MLIRADGETETDVSCQFFSPFVNEGSVRWFLNGIEINFQDQFQFEGVQLSVLNINPETVGDGVGGISSTLTLFADPINVPLYLDGETSPVFLPKNQVFPILLACFLPSWHLEQVSS